MDIPRDSIVKYETALKTDQFLLIADGFSPMLSKSEHFL
jgi:predicted NACHT family NTPase